jgi:peroxiredoxin
MLNLSIEFGSDFPATVQEFELDKCQNEFKKIPDGKPIIDTQVCAHSPVKFSDTCKGNREFKPLKSRHEAQQFNFKEILAVLSRTMSTLNLSSTASHLMGEFKPTESLANVLTCSSFPELAADQAFPQSIPESTNT